MESTSNQKFLWLNKTLSMPTNIDKTDKNEIRQMLRAIICQLSPDLTEAIHKTEIDYTLCQLENQLPLHKKVNNLF